uniref:Rho-GAP domain-containing protein n=1 Tax=Ananas comosus var. bracteatus TaxID=296719 RepID=A0A6V7P1K6_ANACO|nr:unnamed protein product [Ananas comosus var. bracteatus]
MVTRSGCSMDRIEFNWSADAAAFFKPKQWFKDDNRQNASPSMFIAFYIGKRLATRRIAEEVSSVDRSISSVACKTYGGGGRGERGGKGKGDDGDRVADGRAARGARHLRPLPRLPRPPREFEPDVPRRAPSASANVFGVSTESMQCSYDSRGNSIPTILLLMQRRLYDQGGLLEEGIFRITAENSQEEYVREQLNSGVVPDGIDVHCLAGLIKAWFRELPTGVLDSLPPEQVVQCQSEEDSARLARLLPPTKAALLDWAVNLMADVVQEEQTNKMNAHNVAMVFAPNMTKLADPFTALITIYSRNETLDETGHRNPQLLPESCDETLSPFRQAFEEKPTTDEPADTSRSFRDGITLDVGSTSAVDGLNLNSKSNEGERMKVDGESAVRAEMQNDDEELKAGINRVS